MTDAETCLVLPRIAYREVSNAKIKPKNRCRKTSEKEENARMSAEDMDRPVSSNPLIYDRLKPLGVSASVWDDVLNER
jgi:hypothetical protein